MQSFRRHSRGLAGIAASVFLAVWASMAIAPCLMAAEAVLDGDCPHCPDPPPPCHEPAGEGTCTYLDGYDYDGRSPTAPKVEVELVALAGPLSETVVPQPAARTVAPPAIRAPPEPGGPRLHLRHCVLND